MLLYVHYHPHLAVPEFSDKYLRRHTPRYIVVNAAYLVAILIAHPLPILSYLIYIGVIIVLIIFLPNMDDGINYQVKE